MKMAIKISGLLFVGCWVFFLTVATVRAQFEPNNKVGIHVSSPSEENVKAACDLVNASGGDWGYMTLIISEADRNLGSWQNIFNILRRCRAIPIVRIATGFEAGSWRRPQVRDAIIWARFLDSLNWPVAQRYVVLFNEPNHGAEWGGQCDPVDYAQTAYLFADNLKKKNPDFFVMLAGLDQSAPNSPPKFCDESKFLAQMYQEKPALFDLIDGLASHSYPNPDFAAPPTKTGRGSITGYNWELSQLKSLGVKKDLPVFITETGWSGEKLDGDTIAKYYQQAYESYWLPDGRVRAVTPFDFHIGPPFQFFSFQASETANNFQPNYTAIKTIAKVKGTPAQRQKATLILTCPKKLVISSSYECQLWIKNQGQALWSRADNYHFALEGGNFQYSFTDFDMIEPDHSAVINLAFKTPDKAGPATMKISLSKGSERIFDLVSLNIDLNNPPIAKLIASFFPGFAANGENFEFQVFDKSERMVFDQKNVRVKDGVGQIAAVTNVAYDECYRTVLLRKTYLPVQKECVKFTAEGVVINFPAMLRVDLNGDGKLSLGDLFGK